MSSSSRNRTAILVCKIIIFSVLALLTVWYALKYTYSKADFELIKDHSKQDKILFIAADSGFGHKSICTAVADTFKKKTKYGADIYCVGKSIIYEELISRPKLRTFFYRIFIMLGDIFGHKLQIESHLPILNKLVRENNYKAIISFVPNASLILDSLETKAPIMIFPTDLGGIKVWFQSNNGIYFLTSDNLVREALENGVNRSKIHKISRIPAHPKFTEDKKPRNVRKYELGLNQDEDVVLVIFGSCGSEEMFDIMRLAKNSKRKFVFITGKNKRIYKILQEYNKRECNNRHLVKLFVNNIHEWMQAAIAVIGKPGGAVTAEVMASGIPMVVPKHGLMIQEEYNLEFLLENKVAILMEDFDVNLDQILNEISQNPIYSQNAQKLSQQDVLSEICGKMLSQIN